MSARPQGDSCVARRHETHNLAAVSGYSVVHKYDCDVTTTRNKHVHCYRAMLCIRGTSHGPVSVCLSVRHKSMFYKNG